MINAESLTDYPQLTGPSVKAASTRALLPWAVELSASLLMLDETSEYKQRRHTMLASLLLFQRTVQTSGMFFNDSELRAVKAAIRTHLLCYQWLAQKAE